MEFFKLVSENLLDGQQINMTIRKKGDRLVASITADSKGVKDSAVKDIPPMVISGTVQEFEEGFGEAFKPISHTLSLMTELKEYEASIEEARKNTEMAKKAKDKENEEAKKFAEALELARKLKNEHKFSEAKQVLEKAIKMPGSDSKKIEDLLADISKESGAGSLFGGVEDLSDGNALAVSEPSEEVGAEEQSEEEEE